MNKIVTRNPVNRTAARVTQQGPRWHRLAPLRPDIVCSPTPLPTIPLKRGGQNFIGKRVGHLTVVGLHSMTSESCGQRNPRKTITKWSCRCDCGYYVVRKAVVIRDARDATDCCERCRQAQRLQQANDGGGSLPNNE